MKTEAVGFSETEI